MKNTCLLQNQCQTPNLIYRADVENEVSDEKKIYFGLAAKAFKDRFGNHKKYFNHKQHSRNAELRKYIWSLKDAKISYSIKFSIVEKAYGKTKIDACPLCLAEKLHLIEYFDDTKYLHALVEYLLYIVFDTDIFLFIL